MTVAFVEDVRMIWSGPSHLWGAGNVLYVDQAVVKKCVHCGIINHVYVYDQQPDICEGSFLLLSLAL